MLYACVIAPLSLGDHLLLLLLLLLLLQVAASPRR
jgi:hypothetical protein